MDHSRARAVNPITKEHFYGLLDKVIQGEGEDDVILTENIYGADETGIQGGIGVKHKVYGPADQSIQHEQRGGDHENITVLVSICADGTSLVPPVIFKGKGYNMDWDQENPLNCS